MSDVIDLCTGAIALVALGVSLHEVRQANKMHRLSVQPHLTFSRVSGDRSLEITLRNTGLGPARILYFAFSVNGAQSVVNTPTELHRLLKTAGINACLIDRFAYITQGDLVSVGTDMLILKLTNVEPYELREDVLLNFEPLNVHVKYSSLYGETQYASADLITRYPTI